MAGTLATKTSGVIRFFCTKFLDYYVVNSKTCSGHFERKFLNKTENNGDFTRTPTTMFYFSSS